MKKLLCLLLVTLLALPFPAAFAETPAAPPAATAPAETLAPTETPTQSEVLVYAKEPAYMRQTPSVKSEAIADLQTGETVILQGTLGDWAIVRRGLEVGYVSAQYLTEPAVVGSLYTATARANVYAEMSTKSKRLGRISKGETVLWYNATTSHETGESWTGITYGGGVGYIKGKSVVEPITEFAQGKDTGFAAMEKLNASEYFTKERADIFIEYFLDGAMNLAIRVLDDGSLAQLYEDVAQILGEGTPFYIVLSSLPEGYNAARIRELSGEIGEKHQALSDEQKARVPLNTWGYYPSTDRYEVGMTSIDEETVAAFKELIGDIPGITFAEVGPIQLMGELVPITD